MDTKTMKDIKIQGVPVIPFMIMFVIIMVSVYTECLGDDILSTVAFLLALGGILFEIGNKIPVFNKWVGGGSMLAMMVPSWMVYKELIPQKYVEATGELALIGYREEIEAALRTRQLSGISLLGLQDFPGQGTALVGMLNSHLEPKPFDFARPERFRAFFTTQLPLVLLPRYT